MKKKNTMRGYMVVHTSGLVENFFYCKEKDALPLLQKAVGGPIEKLFASETGCGWGNENGLPMHLEPNSAFPPFVGNIVLDMPVAECQLAQKKFAHHPQLVQMIKDGKPVYV